MIPHHYLIFRNPDRGLQGQMNTYEVHVKNHDLVQNEVPHNNKKTKSIVSSEATAIL